MNANLEVAKKYALFKNKNINNKPRNRTTKQIDKQ